MTVLTSPQDPGEIVAPRPNLHTEIVMGSADWDAVADIRKVIERAAERALRAAWAQSSGGTQSQGSLTPPNDGHDIKAEVSVLLTSNLEIQALNNQFRGKDKPTNVLSFPSGDLEDFNFSPDGERVAANLFLGDVALGFETVRDEASKKNTPLVNHVSHLIIHAMLHLLGWDHIAPQEASEMEAFEVEILKTLNIASPYEEFE